MKSPSVRRYSCRLLLIATIRGRSGGDLEVVVEVEEEEEDWPAVCDLDTLSRFIIDDVLPLASSVSGFITLCFPPKKSLRYIWKKKIIKQKKMLSSSASSKKNKGRRIRRILE